MASDNTEHKRGRDECPICMDVIVDGQTNNDRVVFPCGHSICIVCNQGMIRRNDHRCPTCRTPRDGFTRAMADASAEAQMHQDMAEEGIPVPSNTPQVVLFFANEAQGDPFGPLRSVARRVGRGGSQPRVSRIDRPSQNTRGQTMVRNLHRSSNQQAGTTDADAERQDQEEDEDGANGYGGPTEQGRDTLIQINTSDANVPQCLQDLISELLRPSQLQSFQIVRHRVN